MDGEREEQEGEDDEQEISEAHVLLLESEPGTGGSVKASTVEG